MERMQGLSFINVHKGVVALGKYAGNVIALAFEFRLVYDTNRSMTAHLLKFIRMFILIEDQELITADLVENILPATCAPLGHIHPFHRRAPGFSRDGTAMMRAKPHEHNTFRPELFACKLTDVEHTSPRHIRVARVADMGVMCPDNPLCVWAVKIYQAVERF